MASVLNKFRTVTVELTDVNTTVYTAPAGYTGIILLAQAANVTATADTVTFSHYFTDTTVESELVKDYIIPGNDSGSMLTGKLVVEDGDQVKASAGTNNTIKLTMSILESLDG